MHVVSPSFGWSAGQGRAHPVLLLRQEAYNTALNDRCNGYGESVPTKLADSNDPATIPTRRPPSANPDINAVLSVGTRLRRRSAGHRRARHDRSPLVLRPQPAGHGHDQCWQAHDHQQQRLQGYMPVITLHLYNTGAGLLPGANIPSGPGFVDKSNASSVAALAGVDR